MSRFNRAIVRRLGPSFGHGLTTSEEGPPDFELAERQHRAYVDAMVDLGLEIVELGVLEGFPDAYFVEDTAIVGDTFAVLARPGAIERRGEEETIAAALSEFRTIDRIEAPGTVDGGDILEIGDHYLIGVSDRTNEEGAAQLGRILSAHEKSWQAMAVGSGLHLKSSIAALDDETVLVTAEYVDRPEIARWRKVTTEPGEEYAANCVRVNDALLVAAGYSRTAEKIEAYAQKLVVLDVSEARKMDGGLSCMSLRF
jgi:dimethylargininase